MLKWFKTRRGAERPSKTFGQPAASAETDNESGTEGPGNSDKDLYALGVMRERGLIDEEEYRRRMAKIGAAQG